MSKLEYLTLAVAIPTLVIGFILSALYGGFLAGIQLAKDNL